MSLRSFDYECKTCGKLEERLVHKDERDAQNCPCGGIMKRLLSGFGSYSISGNNSASKTPKSTVRTRPKNDN